MGKKSGGRWKNRREGDGKKEERKRGGRWEKREDGERREMGK